jgi:mRNA interferase MazF
MKGYTTMPLAGEFWLADIPFTNGAASKLRPVLVLWEDGADLVVAVVTSANPRSASDVALQEWVSAGLRVPSTVRLSRLDCLEQSLLRRKLGMISSIDATRLKQVWSTEIRLRF